MLGGVENIKIPIAPPFKRGKTDSSRASPHRQPQIAKQAAMRETQDREGHNGEKILTDARTRRRDYRFCKKRQISSYGIELFRKGCVILRLRKPRNLGVKHCLKVHDSACLPVLPPLPLVSLFSVVCHRCVNISIDRSTALPSGPFLPSFPPSFGLCAKLSFLFFPHPSFLPSSFSDSCVNNSKSASHGAKTTLCCQSGRNGEKVEGEGFD